MLDINAVEKVAYSLSRGAPSTTRPPLRRRWYRSPPRGVKRFGRSHANLHPYCGNQ